MEQRTFEEVDTVGRKASKLGLGLSHDITPWINPQYAALENLP